MRTSDLDFDLPQRCIAQAPAEPRDAAQLWVQSRDTGVHSTTVVRALAEHLDERDLLVFNNTKVLPARVWAHRESGARVELLFLEPLGTAGEWSAMVRPAKKPNRGEWLTVGAGIGVQMVARRVGADGQPSALWTVRLSDRRAPERRTEELLEACGEMPLPPYIDRSDGPQAQDHERYQTMFARERGAVAAPTAGLHFTPRVMEDLRAKGIATAEITLHVGMGTFLPIQTDTVEAHTMHSERYQVDPDVVAAVGACRARGGRVIAVGTTSARALEAAAANGTLLAGVGRTDLFISPGYAFRVVDGLFTNFHLPGSTLLLLVGALIGLEEVLRLYRRAIDQDWRFYSYGDAMLLLPDPREEAEPGNPATS